MWFAPAPCPRPSESFGHPNSEECVEIDFRSSLGQVYQTSSIHVRRNFAFSNSLSLSVGSWINAKSSYPMQNVATDFSVLDRIVFVNIPSAATIAGWISVGSPPVLDFSQPHLSWRANFLVDEKCRRKDVALGAMLQQCASCAWRCCHRFVQMQTKRPQMAAGKCCFIHSSEQANPSVPVLASDGNFAVKVCDLPPRVNKLNVDHRVKVNPVKTTTNQAQRDELQKRVSWSGSCL